MSSATSTNEQLDLSERPAARDSKISAWQFFLLLSMIGATVAVMLSRDTHPAALLLLSAAVVSAGLVAVALYYAVGALLGRRGLLPQRPSARSRAALEADKALVLRSIKELEFDRAMGKVGDDDFRDISARLRARAIALMEQLDTYAEHQPMERPVFRPGDPAGLKTGGSEDPRRGPQPNACASCGTPNDADARFCKQCGQSLSQ